MPRKGEPPNRERPPVQHAPEPSGGKVVLKSHFSTRLPNNRRKQFDGVLYSKPLFDESFPVLRHQGEHVHQVVKGLFKERPQLIHASAQQMNIEVAVQFAGVKRLARIVGTTVPKLCLLFKEIIQVMPSTQVALAMSRMKQHDRDLFTDEDAGDQIKIWRERNGPSGNPNARRVTLAKTQWTGASQAAVKYLELANQIRANNPELRSAPILSLCTEIKGECTKLTAAAVNDVFPEVS